MNRSPLLEMPSPFVGPDGYSPRQEPGLALWLDAADMTTLFQESALATRVSADGQPVGGWLDKCGLARSPVQTIAVRRPTFQLDGINGIPAIEFDGADDFLTSTGWAVSQPDTVFAVCARTVTGGTTFDGATLAGRQTLWVNLNQWAFHAGGTELRAGTWDTNPHVHAAVYENVSSSHRLDGAQIASGDVGTNAMEGIVIGANLNYNARITGRVGEILVYSRRLSLAEILRIEDYLKRKWRIA